MRKVVISWLTVLIFLMLCIVNGASGQKVTIRPMLNEPNTVAERALWEEITREFESENPGIEVKTSWSPYEGYYEKATAALAGGSPPDILYCPIRQWGAWSPFLATAPSNLKELFLENQPFKGLAEAIIVDGKLIGLPYTLSVQTLFYNKGMFKEAGLDRAPVTWQELIDFGKKLTKFDEKEDMIREGYGVRYGGAAGGVVQKWLPIVWTNGGALLRKEEGQWKSTFNTPEVGEALQFMVDLIHKHKIASLTFPLPTPAFQNNLAAMFYREPWVIRWIKGVNPDLELGIAPAVISKYRNTLFSFDMRVVTKASPHQEETWKYLSFLLSPENFGRVARVKGDIPWSRKALAETWFKDMPGYDVFSAGLEYGLSEATAAPNYTEIVDVVAEIYAKALYQKVTVEEALLSGDKEINTLLRRK